MGRLTMLPGEWEALALFLALFERRVRHLPISKNTILSCNWKCCRVLFFFLEARVSVDSMVYL